MARGEPDEHLHGLLRVPKLLSGFERYTQDALGAVFYARAEAGIRGAPTIEVDHLLAGVLSQPSAVLPADGVRLLLQHLHGSEPRPSIAFSGVDLPVSESGALVFSYAEQAARGLGSSEIRLEHLLLGILRQNQRVRALFDSTASTPISSSGL